MQPHYKQPHARKIEPEPEIGAQTNVLYFVIIASLSILAGVKLILRIVDALSKCG